MESEAIFIDDHYSPLNKMNPLPMRLSNVRFNREVDNDIWHEPETAFDLVLRGDPPSLLPVSQMKKKTASDGETKDILWEIFQGDKELLTIRFERQQCMNCGVKRDFGGTFCKDCHQNVDINLKRELREFRFMLMKERWRKEDERLRRERIAALKFQKLDQGNKPYRWIKRTRKSLL